jgi:hypothetical protein
MVTILDEFFSKLLGFDNTILGLFWFLMIRFNLKFVTDNTFYLKMDTIFLQHIINYFLRWYCSVECILQIILLFNFDILIYS